MRARRVPPPPRRHQRGVVAIIVGLSIAAMVGFAGLAIDAGRLYVTKTELQNAADACALAASFALNGAPNVPTANFALAENAGLLVAERNRVGFQGAQIDRADVSVEFSNLLSGGAWLTAGANPPGDARFVRCTIPEAGIAPMFMQVLGVGPSTVRAAATASLVPSQQVCNGIPLAMCAPSPGGSAPYGLVAGQWYSGGFNNADQLTGSFNWVDYSPPAGGASELTALLEGPGACLTSVGSQVGQTGAQQSLRRAWNTRFGIYHPSYNPNAPGAPTPDRTGYSYRPQNWPSQANAFADFNGNRRVSNAPYGTTVATGNAETGLSIQSNNTVLQPPALAARGANRRVVTAPIINCAGLASSQTAPIIEYACVLMLHPMDNDNDLTIYMEYIGLANTPGSPCAGPGIPGGPGSTGPFVPGLVQ